ncbi:Protein transport protein [Lachnellula occidentalis]|uniref:Protein transport protein n=1 Tax=Lachnellula occidentalis TaxID=215460 RepID=A0A8H8RTD3_9HELO|nr:Protein transport protein [Lachnellula occidentalis]
MASSRFGGSSLHQRDPRGALFENYNGGASDPTRAGSTSPNKPGGYGGGYGYSGAPNGSAGHGGGLGADRPGYRPATPNTRMENSYIADRGQYSDAVLNELESQNDGHVEGILGKVRQLKDMTVAIGDEIRDSSALAEKMNDSFDGTRVRLRGTMNRMLVMAEKTGVGWKVWLAFFAAVGFLFFYVWVF